MHLRWLAEAVSVERMLLGSDYSFPPADLDPVGTVRSAGFSDTEVARILDHNARELIPRLRTSAKYGRRSYGLANDRHESDCHWSKRGYRQGSDPVLRA